ncbi:MAG: DUF883 family protein [Bdellovibrionales bacterium]
MPKQKSNYPEIDDIRHDLDSLKTNVVELTKHVQRDGKVQTREIKNALSDRLEHLQESGRVQYKNIEKQVKAKPAQSVAVAFAAGLVASMLLRRR